MHDVKFVIGLHTYKDLWGTSQVRLEYEGEELPLLFESIGFKPIGKWIVPFSNGGYFDTKEDAEVFKKGLKGVSTIYC